MPVASGVRHRKVTSALAFVPGDLLQTEPRPGYWGCAVVLSAFPGTQELHPSFHIGITPIVLRHDYALSEIDTTSLSILRFSRGVRVAPLTYTTRNQEVCIGIYTARSQLDLRVLGTVDSKTLYTAPLTLAVGDGTGGDFPLCGPLRRSIGSEAVVAWRRVHDTEAFEREANEAKIQFEAREAERLLKQRQAQRKRRGDA